MDAVLNGAAFAPRPRLSATSAMLDIAGSVQMKMLMTEGAWVEQQQLFLSIVASAAAEHMPEAFMKFNGDGVLIIMLDDEHTLEMIRFAIQVQEQVAEANLRVDGAMGIANFGISAAVTTGWVIPVALAGREDYWGPVIDRASRLCSAVSPGGIFIDSATHAATNLRRVTSVFGAASHRASDDYMGPRQSITVKGIAAAIEYHEVVWSDQPRGVRSDFVSTLTPPPAPTIEARATGSTSDQREVKQWGTVKYFDQDKGFGFITSLANQEEFFVAKNLLAYPEDAVHLVDGCKVAFTPTAAVGAGKSRRAACVILDGRDADGVVRTAPGERPYGWIRVSSAQHYVDLFVSAADWPDGVSLGDEVTFEVTIGAKGARATRLERASLTDAA